MNTITKKPVAFQSLSSVPTAEEVRRARFRAEKGEQFGRQMASVMGLRWLDLSAEERQLWSQAALEVFDAGVVFAAGRSEW